MLELAQHFGAAAEHDTVICSIKLGHAQVGLHLSAFQQVGNAALVAKGLARDRGVVQHLGAHHLAQKLMRGQFVAEVVVVGQFGHLAHAMHQNHFFKTLVSSWIAHDAEVGRNAGAGTKQIQVFSGQQVVDQQGAGGFFAHHNRVTHLDVLQFGGQGAVLHLDAQKLQMVFVIGADDAVGPQQRLAALAAQADHGEVAIGKAQGLVAGGGKAEKSVGPVVDAQDLFF